jgi:hypothetical protein
VEQSIEQWLPIFGYEGLYEVSDLGRLRSLGRDIVRRNGTPQHIPPRVLRPGVHLDGYHRYILYGATGKKQNVSAHRVVLETFIGLSPCGMVACHTNGDPSDNRLSNLRWDTYSANNEDAVRHGTNANTKKTHCPRGHELRGPNIYSSGPGRRSCLACCRTSALCRYRGIPFDPALADEKYAAIFDAVTGA